MHFWCTLSHLDIFLFFFFSSRRRHTRSLCDWSSDVCPSDLMFLTKPSSVSDPTRFPAKYHSRVASKLSDVIGFRNGLPACEVTLPLASKPVVMKLRISRSEERRVGKECRCWWWTYREKYEDV